MLKKYMIFGSVVLLLAALLTITGCSQATDSDGGTTVGYSENYLYGDATAADVDIAVKAAQLGNRSVVLGENLRLTGSGALPAVADFKDRPVRVEHNVRVTNMIINAAYANFTFVPGAGITLEANAVFIYSGIPDDKNIILNDVSAAKVKLVDEPLLGTQGTDTGIALADYEIGGDFDDIHQNVTDLYVLKTLKVGAQSTAIPTGAPGHPRIIVLGKVELGASNRPVFDDFTNFRFAATATLTSTLPGVILPLRAGELLNLPTIEAPVPLTLAVPNGSTIGDLSIDAIKGPGTVTISTAAGQGINSLTLESVADSGNVQVSTGTLGDTTIVKNAGSISLTAANTLTNDITIGHILPWATNTGTITITIGDPAGISSTGEISVLTANEGTINFDTQQLDGVISITKNTGDVFFKQGLILGSNSHLLQVPNNAGSILFQSTFTANGELGDPDLDTGSISQNIAGSGVMEFMGLATFNGNTNIDCRVVFNHNVGLADDVNLALGGDVKLANNRRITLGETTNPATLTLKGGNKLLVGDIPVLAAGTAQAVITPASAAATLTAGPAPDPDSDELGHRLTLADTTITITGELRILGRLRNSTTTSLTIGPTGTLVLEEGALLDLPAISRIVTIGSTTLSAIAANTQFTAVGGAVILKPNSISGNGSTLGTPEEAAAGQINVTSGSTANLSLAGVNLDLQEVGTLVIVADRAVVLESGSNPGKITLGTDTVRFPDSLNGKRINSTVSPATLSGNGILLGSSANPADLAGSGTIDIGVLSGALQESLSIIGGATSSTIRGGQSILAPAP
jgi:hypothetical protein